MRILVIGAGAIGGYFGGRLLEAGRDVTFLVRPRRAAELARTGLAIRSRVGDVDLSTPPVIPEDAPAATFDLVLLACKAYDLEGAITSFTPVVGPDTAILPLLNGIRHLKLLQERFGTAAVLGGQCLISTTLDPDGRIVHLGDAHILTFGELTRHCSTRVEMIAAELSGARLEVRSSDAILQEMWEKCRAALRWCCLLANLPRPQPKWGAGHHGWRISGGSIFCWDLCALRPLGTSLQPHAWGARAAG